MKSFVAERKSYFSQSGKPGKDIIRPQHVKPRVNLNMHSWPSGLKTGFTVLVNDRDRWSGSDKPSIHFNMFNIV